MDKKIYNTLKMMGVSPKDALSFTDALDLFPLTVNPSVKQSMIDTMLNTKVMDKTFLQWFKFFVKESNRKEMTFFHYDPITGLSYPRKYTIDDFDLNRIEKPNIILLIELVLQRYYKQEKVLES